MKGQTQAVTAVLITGVIVASVASAYLWGIPLIQKRQGQAEVNALESKILDLQSGIAQVADSGEGSSSEINLELGNGNVKVKSKENYIDITTYASGATYPVGSWRLIRGDSRQGLSIGSGIYGIEGENTPGAVAVKRLTQSNSVVTYRIEFRNIKTVTPSGPELRLVDIKAAGASKSGGDTTIQFSNEGTKTDTGSEGVKVSPTKRMDRTRSVVSIDLR